MSGYPYPRYKEVRVYCHHPKMYDKGKGRFYVYEHILIAESILGRYLKHNEVVHHLDGNRQNNSKNNLAIVERTIHKYLHVRFDAYNRCGNPNYRRCEHCREYDSYDNLFQTGNHIYHKQCHTSYEQLRYKRRCTSVNPKDLEDSKHERVSLINEMLANLQN